ncbi:phosphate ABC transporter permease, partial [Microbacterium sp. SUBG005]
MTDTVSDTETAPSAPTGPTGPTPARTSIVGKRRVGDSVFLGLSTTAAVSIMIILAGVAIFLILRGLPAITANWSEGDLA